MNAALDLGFAIACVLAVWTGLLLLLAGLGRGLLRLGGSIAGMEAPDLATSAWAGYAAAIVALQVWHLALPVDGRALAALVALSAVGGWAGGRGVPVADRRSRRAFVLPLLLFGAAAIWLADRAIGPCLSYDSANYQTPLVHWYRSHAVVPGLASLNPVFGLGLSGLLFPALLEQGPGTGRSHHFANGFLLFLLLLLLARLLAGTFGRTERPRPQHAMALVLLFPAVMLVSRGGGNWISSHTTDLPVVVTVFAAWCLIAEGFDELRARAVAAGPGPRLFTGLALLAIAPCLKPTTAVFAVTAWLAVAVVFWPERRAESSSPHPLAHLPIPRTPAEGTPPAKVLELQKGGGSPSPGGGRVEDGRGGQGVRTRALLRALLPAFAFATAAIVPWLARNVVLSGYPLFPSAVVGFPVDWRLPVEYPRGLVWWARAYARTPGAWDLMPYQDDTSWIPYWLRVELRAGLLEALLPLALALAGVAAWAAGRRRAPAECRHPALLLLPFLAAVPAWFVSAPLIRYGIYLFWPLCAQGAAQVLPPLLAKPRVRRLLPAAALLWAVSPLALQAYFAVKHRGTESPRTVLARQFFTPPGPDHGFHPLFQPKLETVRVCGTLDVRLPAAKVAERDPAPWPETLPWGSPPPATALLLPGLCPRRPGDLASGFRVAGRETSWTARNAAAVRATAERTGWPVGRLAVYFNVRPELIEAGLRSR